MSRGKRHLLVVNTVCEAARNTVIAYYLTPRQLARRWDGVSPVRMPFARLTANALSAVHRRGVLPAAVKEMRLSTQRFPTAVGTTSGRWRWPTPGTRCGGSGRKCYWTSGAR